VSAAGRTRWGFHRLTEAASRQLVRSAGIRPGDLVLDLGAGRGAITGALVSAGAQVVAVELHPARAQELRRRFAEAPVTVVRADACDLRLPRRPFRVVANPPFGITTALLRRLLSPGSRLLSADVVVPPAAAARWAAGRAPGSRRWSQVFSLRVVRQLPRDVFRPPAPGSAAVLRIERYPDSGAALGRAARSYRCAARLR
jgi:23S rRNA (adenine-N6)-dimethyltransferase